MEYPVLKTPKRYAIRIHRHGERNYEVGTNDSAYQELLSGRKGSYNHFVHSEAEAIAYLEEFGRLHRELVRFESIKAFTESK